MYFSKAVFEAVTRLKQSYDSGHSILLRIEPPVKMASLVVRQAKLSPSISWYGEDRSISRKRLLLAFHLTPPLHHADSLFKTWARLLRSGNGQAAALTWSWVQD